MSEDIPHLDPRDMMLFGVQIATALRDIECGMGDGKTADTLREDISTLVSIAGSVAPRPMRGEFCIFWLGGDE